MKAYVFKLQILFSSTQFFYMFLLSNQTQNICLLESRNNCSKNNVSEELAAATTHISFFAFVLDFFENNHYFVNPDI